jgi:hypothetical protein
MPKSNKRIDDENLKGAPANAREVAQFIRELMRQVAMPAEQLDALTDRIERASAEMFNHRDEANALIAFAVRNGPLETLHAGKYSSLLEDHTLSRITDDEMRILMISTTRMLAALLALRDIAPEAYRRYVQTYGINCCNQWEKWDLLK